MRGPEFSHHPDSPQARQEGHRRLERFIQLLDATADQRVERPKQSLKDAETRIEIIKGMDADKFLNILSIANGLLRGERFTRWKGEAAQSFVGISGLEIQGIVFEPPEHAEKLFADFFEELKQKITAQTKDIWAAKLYIAIIFAHLFSDGNGRLGRNSYSFVKEGHILKEEVSSNRGRLIEKFCSVINHFSVARLFQKEGIYQGEDVNEVANYLVLEDRDSFSEDQTPLKYIAAYRAGLVKNGEKEVYISDWTQDEHRRFDEEYQKVRIDWYQESQEILDQYHQWAVEQLDEALGFNKQESDEEKSENAES